MTRTQSPTAECLLLPQEKVVQVMDEFAVAKDGVGRGKITVTIVTKYAHKTTQSISLAATHL